MQVCPETLELLEQKDMRNLRQQHAVLLVDWSDLDAWRRNQVLRVSLAEGRALTLYEEVHGRKMALPAGA